MQILIAEDDRTSRNILNVVLTRLGYTVIAVADGTAAWQVLQRPDAPKLVILDWVMPGMEGIEICTRLRRISNPETAYTYVILLTAKGSKEDIIMGMDAGADDYVVKPFDHNELRVRIRAGQRIVDLQSELYAVKKELLLQSRTDPLTGILNRRALMPLIAKECSRSLRSKASFALSMLDIDHFKKINDTYGHSAGDAVLKEIVNRINAVIRPYDLLGRFGGEEFLVVVPGACAADIITISERIRQRISGTKVCVDQLEIAVTASQGIVAWDGKSSVDEMIRAADDALYRAKKAGRNCVQDVRSTPETIV